MQHRGDVRHHRLTFVLLAFSMILSSGVNIPGAEGAGGAFGGGNGSAGNPYVIEDIWDLQNMSSNLSAHYVLKGDIDASDTTNWNSGAGFAPVGIEWNGFTGGLDGKNHTITGLFIRTNNNYVGLFGNVSTGSSVMNVGLIGNDVLGSGGVGGLVGHNSGTVSNSYATGNVTGNILVGGLVGYNSGTVKYSYATGNVTGDWVGGLMGLNSGTVNNSYATGNVIGRFGDVGGLVGYNSGTVSNSYATGNGIGSLEVGGLVGYNDKGTVSNSFWDLETSGLGRSSGGTGKTTAEMKTRGTFYQAGWDFTDVWCMIENTTYPLLRWQDTEKPMASAGPNQTIDEGTLLIFDGSGSSDDIGLVFTWTFWDGAAVTLHGVAPEYQFNNSGVFVVTQNVTDGVGNWDTDTMTVTVNDITPPAADAGPDHTVDEGTLVTFNGSGSTDNMGIASYRWTFVYDGSDIMLEGEEVSFMFSVVGEYEVTLKVTDDYGLWDLDRMTVKVLDRTPPSLEVDSPVEDELTRNATYTVTGSTEPLTRVDIRIESSMGSRDYTLTSLEDGSFEMLIDLFEGIQQVIVTATDAMGNPTIVTRDVTLDTVPPDFIITSPDTDSVLTRFPTINIVGQMMGDLQVQVWISFQLVAHTGVFQIEVELEEGENLIEIKAADEAGNEKVVVLTVFRDSIAPVLTVTSPPEDYLITNDITVHFEGTVRDAAGVVIQLHALDLAAELVIGSWQDGEWEYDLVSVPMDLEQDVAIIAYDLAGNEAMMVIYLRYDFVRPQLSIDGEALSYTNQTTVTISGTTEEGIETVTVNGGEKLVENGAISETVDLEEGMNTFVISVVDEAGNPSTEIIEITLDTVPPTFEMDYPKKTDKKKATISGTCSDDVVTMLVNGRSNKVENGTYEVEVDLEKDGKNQFIITFEDRAGNTVTETITIRKGEETPGFGGILSMLAFAALVLAAVSLRRRGLG